MAVDFFLHVALFIASTALTSTAFMSLSEASFNLVFGRIFLVCHQYFFTMCSSAQTISVVSFIILDACVTLVVPLIYSLTFLIPSINIPSRKPTRRYNGRLWEIQLWHLLTFSLQQAGRTPAVTIAFCGDGVEPGGSLAAAGPSGTHGMGKEQEVVSSRKGVCSVRTRTSLGYPGAVRWLPF